MSQSNKSQSDNTLNMSSIVGIVLVLSGLIFGTIILFGLMDTGLDVNRVIMFKTVYFVFIAIILGIVYLTSQDYLSSKSEHVMIILSILFLSAGMAAFAGNMKVFQDTKYVYTLGDQAQLEAQNLYYSQYVDVLKADVSTMNNIDRMLDGEIGNLSGKIFNKTPIIVETIVELPPEIVYVDEPQVEDIYYDYEEYEEDDD